MEQIYTQNYKITGTHLDCHGRLKPSALLGIVQNAAGEHCKILKLDWETLTKLGLFWAVLRHRIEILRQPADGDVLTVQTWPMPTTRSSFPRACQALDSKGNVVFRTHSLWVLMDTHTRAMVLPGKSGIGLEGIIRGDEPEAPGSITPQPLENTATRRVCIADLDRNGHMTNSRYLDWIDDLFRGDDQTEKAPREILICYLCEALEGQQLTLHWQATGENCVQIEGLRAQTDVPEKHTRVFAAKVHF